MNRLTDRQSHVLELFLNGYDPSEIAERMSISKNTVNWHIFKILQKKLFLKIGIICFVKSVEIKLKEKLLNQRRKSLVSLLNY